MTMAEGLLLHAVGDALIADCGYDADWFRELVRSFGLKAVIASKLERLHAIPKDRKLYALRYLGEDDARRRLPGLIRGPCACSERREEPCGEPVLGGPASR